MLNEAATDMNERAVKHASDNFPIGKHLNIRKTVPQSFLDTKILFYKITPAQYNWNSTERDQALSKQDILISDIFTCQAIYMIRL